MNGAENSQEISNSLFNKSTHLEFSKSIRYVVPTKKIRNADFFRRNMQSPCDKILVC